jgi:hypothetical protein
MGEGRLVGVACYMLNPSNHALGCWWGEGDEKIYLDNSSFPTYFGTGSEDYFNYSWCSDDVFYYPYCGQPRNDGPSNRGFVSTYRWHIADDIPFRQQLAFYMELYHTVAGFVHARMVYMYGKKGLIDDHGPVSIEDVRPVVLPELTPLSVKPFGFVEAENAVKDAANTAFAYDPLWAGGKILMWTPKVAGEKLHFDLKSYGGGIKDFRVFFGHMENGGKVKMYVNGQLVKLRNNDILDLSEQGRTLNRSYRIEKIDFKEGSNEVILENCSEGEVKIGIDMFAVSG